MEDREHDMFEDYEVERAFNILTSENEQNDQVNLENNEVNLGNNKVNLENDEEVGNAEALEDQENREDVMMETVHIREIQEENYRCSEDEKDTSFNKYVRQNSKQPQSRGLKWLMRTAKLGLFIMLLPLIVLMGGVIGGGVVALLGGGLGLICLSIGVLIGAAFFLSLSNSTLILLMLSLTVALAATGGLIFLIGVSCCRVLIKGVKYYKMKKSAYTGTREAEIA